VSKAVIILAFFAVLASAYLQTPPTPTPKDFSALFAGFNDQLAIASDDDFNKCAHVPIIAELQKLYADLNADKPNPIALVADVTKLYNDWSKVKVACPAIEKTYEAFFANFEHEAQTNPKGTLLKVAVNVFKNFKEIRTAATSIFGDIGATKYYDAGSDVGKVVQLTLAGMI
jgi:hypothetical protein